MSPAKALRIRAHADRALTGSRPSYEHEARPAPATAAIATIGIDERTGDGSARRTIMVRKACTTWPAKRSHATARNARPTSLTSRPWLTAAVDVAHDPAGQRDVEE